MIRPIRTKDWIAFLKAHGCTFIRINASHHIYKCPGSIRTIVFRGNEKDIEPYHIKTNLRTLNLSLQELYKWIDENC
jgi:predicted RNA binding protein YcfA (HicA-like mRNA interferase family)